MHTWKKKAKVYVYKTRSVNFDFNSLRVRNIIWRGEQLICNYMYIVLSVFISRPT